MPFPRPPFKPNGPVVTFGSNYAYSHPLLWKVVRRVASDWVQLSFLEQIIDVDLDVVVPKGNLNRPPKLEPVGRALFARFRVCAADPFLNVVRPPLVKELQNRTTVDHVNIIGMARAQRGLGNFGEAMAHYRRYTGGLSYIDFPREYWQAELERCQCHLEGYFEKPKAMKNLVIQINSLKVKDSEMGGLAGEFEAIRSQAQSKAGRS